jgi:hypothetical protein
LNSASQRVQQINEKTQQSGLARTNAVWVTDTGRRIPLDTNFLVRSQRNISFPFTGKIFTLQESVTQGKKYEMQTESTVANQAAA